MTWPEIYLYDRSHQQLHGQMLDALLALQGKAGQQFVAALRNYADRDCVPASTATISARPLLGTVASVFVSPRD